LRKGSVLKKGKNCNEPKKDVVFGGDWQRVQTLVFVARRTRSQEDMPSEVKRVRLPGAFAGPGLKKKTEGLIQ